MNTSNRAVAVRAADIATIVGPNEGPDIDRKRATDDVGTVVLPDGRTLSVEEAERFYGRAS